jgi:hypothetical protein
MAGPLGALGAAGFLGGGGGAAAGAGAGMAALGPWMLGATALQGGFQAIGSAMEQTSADKAIEEANKNLIRTTGIQSWMQDREQGKQMAALREGYGFMNSPVFQQVKDKEFGQEYALAGKYFNPYVFGQIDRLT